METSARNQENRDSQDQSQIKIAIDIIRIGPLVMIEVMAKEKVQVC